MVLIDGLREAVADDFGEAHRRPLLIAGAAVLDEVVSWVTNELADRDAGVLVCIDDIHHVTSPASQRSIHRFVTQLPQDVRVVLASSSSEPLPLSRLRVENELLEITGADLAMSTHEAHQLLDRGDPGSPLRSCRRTRS